jgi:hypothetical protein
LGRDGIAGDRTGGGGGAASACSRGDGGRVLVEGVAGELAEVRRAVPAGARAVAAAGQADQAQPR